jgi:hypothetical protein
MLWVDGWLWNKPQAEQTKTLTNRQSIKSQPDARLPIQKL